MGTDTTKITKHPNYFRIFITFLCVNVVTVSTQIQDDNPYRHKAILDPNGKYQLEWLVKWNEKRVIFNVTVATNGYVGFGLSRKGKMTGADLIVGGVGKDGKPYFTDRHAIGNQLPKLDPSQDWTLHEAWEKGAQTFLSFSRPFETCDGDHDLPITDDVMTIIWAYSENDDELQYHFQNRGGYNVYLLDPDLAPREMNNLRRSSGEEGSTRVFNVTGGITLNEEDFMYWCSYHKVPTRTKQHIIGFDAIFPSERDRRHVHHLSLYRCYTPMGVDAETLFEGRARSGGNECYRTVEPDSIEARYCTEVLYVWAVGGKPTFFPDHVGLPMSIQNGTEYFLMETHYDNPNRLANLRVSVTLQTYYTSQLRKHDAGLLWVGHWTPGLPSLLIPPNSLSHVTMGHCAPGCTQRFLEKEVNIFAAYLHTHLAGGRGVRALHFRGNKELPWIISDDNYNFDYQQTRILRQERKLVPGDQLMIRCTYETTNSNGSVVEGGFSTRQEMCAMGLLYYNRVPNFTFCLSEIKTEAYHNFLGVRNVTWDGSIKDMVITDPPRFSGLTMKTYADNHIEWDIRMRTEIQRYHKYEPQTVNCASALPIESIDSQNNQESVDDNDDDDDNEVGRSRRILRYSGDGGISLALRNVASQRRQSFQDEFDRKGSNNVGSGDDGGGDEHLSALPQGVARYRRPTQCTRATISSRRSG